MKGFMKDTITQNFINFFRSIGINPYLVFFLILSLLVFFKVKSYWDGKEKNKWDYIYDTVFFIVAFGLMLFFSLYLIGIIDL